MPNKEENSRRSMRLLFILDEPSIKAGGGAETFAFTLAKYLVQRGCPVLTFAPQPSSWHIRSKEQDGYETYNLGIPFPRNHWLFSLFYNLRLGLALCMHSNQFDIIHVHGARGLKTVAIFSRMFKKKSVMTIVRRFHWLFIFRKNVKNIFQRVSNKLINLFNGYIVISRDIEQLVLSYNIQNEKLFYIPNGIEIHPRYCDKPALRHELCIPPSTPVALCVGRLHWQKNIPFLLNAWKMTLSQVPHAKLILLGDGPLREKVESLITTLDLRDSVECRGYSNNVSRFLQATDIFVLPSRMEGCPIALLEAMGCMLACIVTDSPGNDELITHNSTGLLVQFGNTAQLAEYLHKLLTDKILRNRLGTAAYQTIHERFMIQEITDRHIKCYRQLSAL